MIPNPLIHIGYHKTGTTWLQKTLFSINSNVFIPLSPNGKPKYLGKYFFSDTEGHLLSPFQSNKEVILQEVETLVRRLDLQGKIPVISNERLSGNPHSGSFDSKLIADRIKDCFPNAKIFCVIREQKDMILSTYFQYLKIGGTDSLTAYLTRKYDGKRPGFSSENLRYVNLISYYHQLFSPENVLVLPYEMLNKNPGKFIKRVGNFLSVNIDEDLVNPEVKYNTRAESPITQRFPALNLFYNKSSVNAYSPLSFPLFSRLIQATNGLFAGKSRSHIEKIIQQIEQITGNRYLDSNRELSELIGMDLSEYGYHNRQKIKHPP
jgi:sulfotransferase family protein